MIRSLSGKPKISRSISSYTNPHLSRSSRILSSTLRCLRDRESQGHHGRICDGQGHTAGARREEGVIRQFDLVRHATLLDDPMNLDAGRACLDSTSKERRSKPDRSCETDRHSDSHRSGRRRWFGDPENFRLPWADQAGHTESICSGCPAFARRCTTADRLLGCSKRSREAPLFLAVSMIASVMRNSSVLRWPHVTRRACATPEISVPD